jgi:recombinational DNA repair ATPase RecF
MEMKNFMTYAHAVIEPGPHLNLVLGPNGKLSTVYTIYTLHANAYFI